MEWMAWEDIGVLAINQFGAFIVCMISSFLFVYFLLKILSPKIEISPFINKRLVDGKESFVFKVVNKSIFNAYNVKFHLVKREPTIVENNKVNHRAIDSKLVINELFCIPRYKKDKDYGDYAALIRTETDISSDIGTDNLEYELSVSASHGLSNITKVVNQRFNKSTDIYSDGFKFGKSLKINN